MPGLEPFASCASAILQWLLITSASATLIAGVVLIVQKMFSGWLTPGGRQRLWLLVVVRLLLPVLPASALSLGNLPLNKLWDWRDGENATLIACRAHSRCGRRRKWTCGDAASFLETSCVPVHSVPFTPPVMTSPIIQPRRSWSRRRLDRGIRGLQRSSRDRDAQPAPLGQRDVDSACVAWLS